MRSFRCANCHKTKPQTFLGFQIRKSGNLFCKSCEPAIRLNRIAQRYGEEETIYYTLQHGS